MTPVNVGNWLNAIPASLCNALAARADAPPTGQVRTAASVATIVLVSSLGCAPSSAAAPHSAELNPSTHIESFHVQSRELVDLEITREGALTILISSPGTATPGIYRWGADESQPRKLCEIAAPSFFSFDRKVIIERIRGNPSSIRLYRPKDCARLAQFDIEGRVLDVDVRGTRIAAAVRLPDQSLALRLYDRNGALQASTSIGRNIEMGFSSDGRLLLNFDLSDTGPRAWSIPSLLPVDLPSWLNEGEVTFVAGSPFVKRYASNTLSIARWPAGRAEHTLSATAATRIRALSASGAVALVHEFRRQRDVLDWVDARTGVRIQVAQGSGRASIDHAAISPDAKRLAWSWRSGTSQQVIVQRRMAPPASGSEAGADLDVVDTEPALDPLPRAIQASQYALWSVIGATAPLSLAPQQAASAPRAPTQSPALSPPAAPIPTR